MRDEFELLRQKIRLSESQHDTTAGFPLDSAVNRSKTLRQAAGLAVLSHESRLAALLFSECCSQRALLSE